MNGQVEHYVQTIKESLKPIATDLGIMHMKLNNFLIHYGKAAHLITDESPALLMYQRNIWSRRDLMLPNKKHKVKETQTKIVETENKNTNVSFDLGDNVLFRTFDKVNKWK